MLKPILIFTLTLVSCNIALAQKIDTVFGYLKKSGEIVSTRDSADYMLLILPPDTNVDKNLFRITELYPDNRIRLLGTAINNQVPLMFHGNQIMFFSNGHKMRISSYVNGQLAGDAVDYYPNGKLYRITTYFQNRKKFLKQCNDSTGLILTQNGNGKWIAYFAEEFHDYIGGKVENGVEEGEWRGKMNDSINLIQVYKKGQLISASALDKSGKKVGPAIAMEEPIFPGGLDAFGKFVSSRLNYPISAKESNIQGRVLITFIVETDGSLSDIKVARSVGGGLDEEAIRVIKLSPRWIPGKVGGKPIRAQYVVPVSFTLKTN